MPNNMYQLLRDIWRFITETYHSLQDDMSLFLSHICDAHLSSWLTSHACSRLSSLISHLVLSMLFFIAIAWMTKGMANGIRWILDLLFNKSFEGLAWLVKTIVRRIFSSIAFLISSFFRSIKKFLFN